MDVVVIWPWWLAWVLICGVDVELELVEAFDCWAGPAAAMGVMTVAGPMAEPRVRPPPRPMALAALNALYMSAVADPSAAWTVIVPGPIATFVIIHLFGSLGSC